MRARESISVHPGLALSLAAALALGCSRRGTPKESAAPSERTEALARPAENPSSVEPSPRADATRFPVKVSGDKKYLVDASGAPFLLVGDAAWSLVAGLSKDETILYLDDRARRGFTTILVELVEHHFTPHSPHWKNAEGLRPFADANDFSTVNEAYFERARWAVERAAERGLLVLLAPAYLGYDCEKGDHGWCKEMFANGVDRLTRYGRFVGERFRSCTNVVWVHGGDHVPSSKGSPSQMDLVNAVRSGIEEGGGRDQLRTAHWSRDYSSSEVSGVNWLDLDATYTRLRNRTTVDSLDDWGRSRGVRPTFLIEGYYEGEHKTTGVEWRAQMIQPILAGSTGFVFGNSPIWFFGNPSDENPAWAFNSGPVLAWKAALGSEGARDASRVAALFRSLPWQDLEPDLSKTMLKERFRQTTAIYREPADGIAFARSKNGRVAVAYYDAALTGNYDLESMAGDVTVFWFDPTSGARTAAPGSPFSKSSRQLFTPPGRNASGAEDWVLVFTSGLEAVGG